MNKLMIIVIFLFIAGLSVVQAFDVGDRVMADWSGDDYYYPGTIVLIEGNQYFIIYDDYDREWLVSSLLKPDDIGVGTQVQCSWEGAGVYYPGTIMQRNGNAIFVQYDDGDEEYTTIAHIRVE